MQSNIKIAKSFEYCKVGHLISSERIAYQKDISGTERSARRSL